MMSNLNNYFMLYFNPWPLMSSISAFNLLFSLLLFFKYKDYEIFTMNVIGLTISSFLWWIIYSSEFNLEGKNSFFLEKGIKFSMLLFISSEIFFFFSFFWSYFHFYLSPTMEIGLIWPPKSLIMFDCLNVPLINTLLLIGSGVTVTISHYFLVSGNKNMALFYLAITILLGILFTTLQVMEYNSSFFSISDSTFGTSFFVLTGFHGIHVLVGTIYLSVTFIRFFKFSTKKSSCLGFELSSWYWHFVDVVWIFLYFFIYYMNN